MSHPQQRIVLFGATSAIAQAAARLWVQRGAHLVLVGRDPDKLQSLVQDLQVRAGPQGATHLHSLQADLNQFDQHARLIREAVALLGSIDTVLIAHGSLPDQVACQADPARSLQEIQTNATSAIHLCECLAPLLAAQGHGTLAVISSVAGDRGRQSNYLYGAAKGMVTLYLQGLRNRLHPAGVQVITIKPGFVDTPMTAAFDKKGPLWASATQVAQGILHAIDRRRDVAYLPGFWRWIMLMIRLIPEPLFKRLKL